MTTFDPGAKRALAEGKHGDPHAVLGAHEYSNGGGTPGVIVRVYQPEAADCYIIRDGVSTMMKDEGQGFFSIVVPSVSLPLRYSLRFLAADGRTWERGDPYRHWPTIGDMDLYL